MTQYYNQLPADFSSLPGDIPMGLDFETYSNVDLKTAGMGPYFHDPETKVLIGCVVMQNGDSYVLDFVEDYMAAHYVLQALLDKYIVVAHNAAFEAECIEKLGCSYVKHYIDSALAARMVGASSTLANTARQLSNEEKIAEGKNLIQLFSVPNEDNQGKPFTWEQLQNNSVLSEMWTQFIGYCVQDAKLGLHIWRYATMVTDTELEYWQLTHKMNKRGWPVNLAETRWMLEQYEDNTSDLLKRFRAEHDPEGELNIKSPKQLIEWCAARGVRTSSFDKEAVQKLYKQVSARIERFSQQGKDATHLIEVRDLLLLKADLGGTSLSKLPVILAQTVPDANRPDHGRLYHQYMHAGAGQTGRTSGRGVQMQNLARANGMTLDLDDRFLYDSRPTNEQLAHTVRLLFQAAPDHELIVADLSAIESRGLAWFAGATWKLDAYSQGKDLYKVQAAAFLGTSYENVTKDERQLGKVGELSCGYGAGPGAVRSFAAKMGTELTEQQAANLVHDWRKINPEIVNFWKTLDDALHAVVERQESISLKLYYGCTVTIRTWDTPTSLRDQHPGAQSVIVTVEMPNKFRWHRVFQGCFMKGRNIVYHRASEAQSGQPWSSRRAATPTAPAGDFTIYGGKLAGILTQSLCREIFFNRMLEIEKRLPNNAQLIGQFHDEVVVEAWADPKGWPLSDIEALVHRQLVRANPMYPGLPMAATCESARRYIK